MKFSNGCWLMQEGVGCFAPEHVYSAKIDKERVVLCCPTSRIRHRGDTLGGINLTIEITAPMSGVLRVRTVHHKGLTNHGPAFELHLPPAQPLDAQETPSHIVVRSGDLCVRIDKELAAMDFLRGDERLTGISGKDLAYIKTNWKGFAYDKGPQDAFMRGQLDLSVGERIYGLGERFGAFVKNGQSIEICNEDGGTSTEQAYKNIPFYLSSKGYGVFVNHPEHVSFEVGSEMVSKVGFSVKGESLDFFLIDGPAMKDVLVRYTDLTGKPALPAPWTFGLWLSTSFTTDYDEATVNSFVDGMLSRGIPLSVFHFDCFWMRGFNWCDFVWDPEVFPDPVGMIARLKAKGLKICVWINPYIAQESCIFDEGAKNGYFLKRPNGDVWQWDMWQPGMAIVDFTNPDACAWYTGKLKVLLDMGVDCFKTDFGERIPTDAVYFDGSDPEKMHNYYTYLYNKTVFDLLVHEKGREEAVLFARSATAGCQQFPVHWGGDCWSTYEAMQESLRGGLSLTSSGFGFWSHDIGGFEQRSTADVYKRWCAFGLLSSHSRLHGSSSYRVPGTYDEEAVDVLRRFTKLKAQLMPYLYAQAVNTSRTGVPMMRAMALEFPQDRNCDYLCSQYMLGDSLLSAPVLNDKSIAEYYLPDGMWTNVFTGEARIGGKWYREPCDYMSIPLFAREGSIVAFGAKDDGVRYDYACGAQYRVYSLADGCEAKTSVCGMDGNVRTQLSVCRSGDEYEIDYDADVPCTVMLMLRGEEVCIELEGACKRCVTTMDRG